MHPAEATVIMQTLLSCRTLFSDFFPIPNYVTLTSFEYAPSDGITVQEWKNGSQGTKKKIKFQGKVIDTIQLQMFERDGKMVLGGQVSEAKGHKDAKQCAVVGDTDELRLLTAPELCKSECFYRLKDEVYMINAVAGFQCLVFDLNGKNVRKFDSPPQIDCSSPYGLLPEEDLFVFMKNGECKQVDYSAPETSWAATSCPRREIELGPNKLSEYYHLRYLLTISGCGENVTDIGDPDNIYVRFMHKNETLIEPTEPPSTTVVVVTEERNIQEYLAYGLFSVVGFVVLVLVILGVIYRKKLLDKCRKKKEPSAPEKPAPDLAAAEPLTLDLEPETARPKVKERDIAEDTIGNVDENLKSVNPVRPNIRVGCLFLDPARPDKHVRANDVGDDYYLLSVVDVGKYPNFVFIVTPFYYRSMGFFMPFSDGYEKATIADILTVAWNYLKGIHQLHSVEYGHNDIKPGNFMQKDECENTIVLCDFGLVKKLGSKRRESLGTPTSLPLTTFKLEDPSNVDDHQSWLFLWFIMVTRSLQWLIDRQLESEVAEDALHDVFKQKINLFRKMQTKANGKPIPDLTLIAILRHAIITGCKPKNPVDSKKVVSIIEEAQSTFDFKYATHEWGRFDQKPDRKIKIPAV